MKIGLTLTNDWEIFGNGSGDFFELQEKPLLELLKVSSDSGVPFTIFAEIGQQLWGARRLFDSDPSQSAIGNRWEAALQAAVLAGADVQAHFHPQWLDAKRENNKWVLGSRRVFGDLPRSEIIHVLSAAKAYLEGLLRTVDPMYECVCFRAGAFYIEPSQNAVAAMRLCGYKGDSSVVLGMRDGGRVDFRDLPLGQASWPIGRSVTESSAKSDLYELPVYARRTWDSALVRNLISPRLYYLLFRRTWISAVDNDWQRRRNIMLRNRYPLVDRGFVRGGKISGDVFRKVLNRTALILDYDQLPAAVFVQFLEDAWKEYSIVDSPPIVPIVALGHSKGMPDTLNLQRIIKLARQKMGDRLCFINIRDALKNKVVE